MNSSSPKRLTDTNKIRRTKRKHYLAFNNSNNNNEEQDNIFAKKMKLSNNSNFLNSFENNFQKNNLKSSEYLNIKSTPIENNFQHQCNLYKFFNF